MANQLTSLSVNEVSLVDRPANAETDPVTGLRIPRARVALFKADANTQPKGDKPPPVLKGAATMTLEELEARQGTLEKNQKDQDATIAALKNENAVLKMSAKEKAAFDGMTAKQKEDYMAGDADKKASMMKEACKGDDGDGDAATKLAKLEGDRTELQKRVDADGVRIAKLESDVAKAQHDARISYFTKRAEAELPNTAGSPVEKGQMLMDLAHAFGGEADPRFVKSMTQLVTADKILGSQFKEIGKWGGGAAKAGAAAEAKVAIIMKDEKLDEGHAWIELSKREPDLFKEYEREQRMFATSR